MKLTKSELEKLISEAAADYVWGVKNPGRVANQYSVSILKIKELISEELDMLFEDTSTTPAGIAVDRPDDSIALSRSGAAEMDVFENKREQWAKTIEEIVHWATSQEKDPAGVIPSASVPPNPDFITLIGEDFNALMGLIGDALREKDRIEQMETPPLAGE